MEYAIAARVPLWQCINDRFIFTDYVYIVFQRSQNNYPFRYASVCVSNLPRGFHPLSIRFAAYNLPKNLPKWKVIFRF